MKALKKLAGQTAVYGLPSIVGRLLNYTLVPLHTSTFVPERFGVITEMYSYVAFLVVFLTYGMETAYFRYQTKNDSGNNSTLVFSTVMISLISTTTLFIAAISIFSQEVADFINYPDNSEYVVWFAFIVGLDAISSIPLAKLRIESKATKFAIANILSILVFIGLNFFWLKYCLPEYEAGNRNWIVSTFYSPHIGIGYVFLANLFASIAKFIYLFPSYFKIQIKIDFKLLKQMLIYGSPLLIASLAIIVNESADKIMLKWMLLDDLGKDGANEVVGIYGACYKLSIIITLFIQAFRYAAEPFFFSQEKNIDAKETYAVIMKYFVIVCSIIFLGVTFYLDILKYFIPSEAYWVGLKVVPILLFANIFLGIFYNLSIWYKLSEKTRYGAMISVVGAIITISLNLILIPSIQYMGSAWATFICYGSMVVLSYYFGQKYYPINYPVKRVLGYLLLSAGLYFVSDFLFGNFALGLKLTLNTALLLAFISVIYVLEKPKKEIIS